MKLFSRERKKLVAVFDVGSASIGGALVSVDGNEKPVVLQVVRRDIPFQEKINHKRFFAGVLSAFDVVSEKIEGTQEKEIVDEAVCFFSAPWYASRFETIHLKEDAPFVISEDRLEEEINKKVSIFEKEGEEKYQGGDLGVPELVEKENMRVRLNGYDVAEYEGKKVENAEISYYASVVPERVLGEIEGRIFRRFNERDIKFRTFPFASFIVARDFLNQPESSFVLLDITGEMTDILWVKDGVISKGASFPLGRNFLLRKIAEDLHVDIALGESLLFLYLSKKADEKTSARLEKTLAKCGKEWRKKFEENTRHFSRGGIAPQNVFFTSDRKYSWWFRQLLSEDASFFDSSDSFQEKSRRVYFLGETLVNKFCTFSEGVKKDAFLGTEAVFIAHSQRR